MEKVVAVCLLSSMALAGCASLDTQEITGSQDFTSSQLNDGAVRLDKSEEEIDKINQHMQLGMGVARVLWLETQKYELISPDLMLALFARESRFDPYAVGSVGEKGLGQVTDQIGYWAASQLGIENFEPKMLFDPVINIRISCYFLNHLLTKYNCDLNMALTAYNRGEPNLLKYVARTGTAETKYSRGVIQSRHRYQ